MDESLEKALLDMEARDKSIRAELTAAGELNVAYHPRLEEVHRANSSRLRQIIAVFGWPGFTLVGERGATASWRIALHSITEPDFMRRCRDLIDAASQAQEAPRWQFAIIDDRIRVYEGRPQKFGTQLKWSAEGVEPYPLEDQSSVNSMRMQVGLPPLAQALTLARSQPLPPAETAAAREAAELEFRRSSGWIFD